MEVTMKNILKMVLLAGLVSSNVVTAQTTRGASTPVAQASAGMMSNVGEKVKAFGSKVYNAVKNNPKTSVAVALATLVGLEYFNPTFKKEQFTKDGKLAFLNGVSFQDATGYTKLSAKVKAYRAGQPAGQPAGQEAGQRA